MAAPLDIYAGPSAMAALKQHGFYPLLFKYFLGASGGPKWFVLTGLDRVIFPAWFQRRGGQVQVIGSSAGAFRAACFVQDNPLAAINRLAHIYANTTYPKKTNESDVSRSAKQIIHDMLGPEGVMNVLTNERFKLHVFVAKCHGMMKNHGRLAQLGGLTMAASGNAIHRRYLQQQFSRFIFSAPHSKFDITDPYDLKTEHLEFSENNVKDVLLASGSIPIIMQGVEHIQDAPAGVYRDGGIIDYHFDLHFGPEPGLVLYPHFYPRPVTGWFDKGLKGRWPHANSYDNTVMLVPSADFVNALPFNKIPDRSDFKKMNDQTRITYWETVIQESDRLGEYFMKITEDQSIVDLIKPLPFNCLPLVKETKLTTV
ncbi:patatin-like phospholipase family protein [Alteromonas ponticola]|uniref:Patatin-like phospholipase family protein n=1 Tax=Alteromonas aquimaris TaxID=2998417 RepID=A0ABT3P7S1_9ALTE|nr:patatin-like phospholipase family protein [Alteromonas aquimaris]MCW8108794.1 patatin-like phospholipase family protein [Alteromonas aquimaris]